MGHVIDKCPTIICKHCRAVGHPNWLCPGNPHAEKRSEKVEKEEKDVDSMHPRKDVSKEVSPPVSPGLRNKNSIYAFESTQSLKEGSRRKAQAQVQPQPQNQYGDFKSDFRNRRSSGAGRETNSSSLPDLRNSSVAKDAPEEEVKKEMITIQYYQKMIDAKWGELAM